MTDTPDMTATWAAHRAMRQQLLRERYGPLYGEQGYGR